MITAVHNLVYSDDPAATRAFFADVLGWSYIDAGGGWLIFGTGPSELGVHPTSGDENEGWSTPKAHQISLICDDIDETVAELRSKGATFDGDIREQGFGRTITMLVPGSLDMLVYQPEHPLAHS